MLSGEVHPCIKCDLDNVIKIVMDGLQNCAYIDDKQVIGIVARKYYATEARVEVRVESI